MELILWAEGRLEWTERLPALGESAGAGLGRGLGLPCSLGSNRHDSPLPLGLSRNELDRLGR